MSQHRPCTSWHTDSSRRPRHLLVSRSLRDAVRGTAASLGSSSASPSRSSSRHYQLDKQLWTPDIFFSRGPGLAPRFLEVCEARNLVGLGHCLGQPSSSSCGAAICSSQLHLPCLLLSEEQPWHQSPATTGQRHCRYHCCHRCLHRCLRLDPALQQNVLPPGISALSKKHYN